MSKQIFKQIQLAQQALVPLITCDSFSREQHDQLLVSLRVLQMVQTATICDMQNSELTEALYELV